MNFVKFREDENDTVYSYGHRKKESALILHFTMRRKTRAVLPP